MKNEWNKFKVGTPSTRKNWTEMDCSPFDRVAHITHLSTSLDIIHYKKIKSALVFDESKLNEARIFVSWLSPNYWSDGFRYGNIRFQFKWDQIVKDKRFFGVEAIAYGIPACRILITDNEHNELEEYIPEQKDGPWWYDTKNNQHYFNNNYCLEFMVESDLEISRDVELDFVAHHSKWCALNSNNPRSCCDLGMFEDKAAGLFMSAIVARNINTTKHMFLVDNPIREGVPNALYKGFSTIYFRLVETDSTVYSGEVRHTDNIAAALARAALCAYSVSNDGDIAELRSMFKNKKHFGLSLEKVILDHFNLEKSARFIAN